MTRRGAARLLLLVLGLAGTEGAHALAYRLVYPDALIRAQVLTASGHGYLRFAPDAAALAGALALVALLARARATGPSARLGFAPVLAFCPLLFALQECAESGASGHSPLLALYAPTFLPGILLALPCALVVALLARLLLGGADRLGAVLRRAPRLRRAALLLSSRATPHGAPRRRPRLTGSLGERGPPLRLAAGTVTHARLATRPA